MVSRSYSNACTGMHVHLRLCTTMKYILPNIQLPGYQSMLLSRLPSIVGSIVTRPGFHSSPSKSKKVDRSVGCIPSTLNAHSGEPLRSGFGPYTVTPSTERSCREGCRGCVSLAQAYMYTS